MVTAPRKMATQVPWYAYTGDLWRGDSDLMDLGFCFIEGGDLYISDSKNINSVLSFAYRGSESGLRLNSFFYI